MRETVVYPFVGGILQGFFVQIKSEKENQPPNQNHSASYSAKYFCTVGLYGKLNPFGELF